MLKRLEMDSVQSDLRAVEGLLSELTRPLTQPGFSNTPAGRKRWRLDCANLAASLTRLGLSRSFLLVGR